MSVPVRGAARIGLAACRRERAGYRVRLSVDNLACRRSGRRIFSGLTFALGPGDALAVTGRNGAGKSSLLAILTGRLRPDAGRIALSEVGEASLPECLHAIGHRDGLKSSLSAGQRRRVALARLLVCARPLWLLDEPTAALDTGSQALLAGLMGAHRAGGGVVIAATHQPLGLDGAAELRIEPGPGPEPEPAEDWA